MTQLFEIARDEALSSGDCTMLANLCTTYADQINTLELTGHSIPLTFCIRVSFRDTYARNNLLTVVKTLIDAGANPTTIDTAGLTAIQSAQRLGYNDIVEYLQSLSFIP